MQIINMTRSGQTERWDVSGFRIMSWVVAGAAGVINFDAVFSWYPEFYGTWYMPGEGSRTEYYAVMVIVQVLLAVPVVCIWFADYLANLEWGDQRWSMPLWSRQSSLFPSSVGLFKLVAWAVLLGFLLGSLASMWNKAR